MRRSDRVDWTGGRALCAEDGVEPEDFFELENATDEQRDPDALKVVRALDLCERCPLIEECFFRAVRERSLGIRGGTTADERGMRYRLARSVTG